MRKVILKNFAEIVISFQIGGLTLTERPKCLAIK